MTAMIRLTRSGLPAPKFWPAMDEPAVLSDVVTTLAMWPSLLPTPVTAEAVTP